MHHGELVPARSRSKAPAIAPHFGGFGGSTTQRVSKRLYWKRTQGAMWLLPVIVFSSCSAKKNVPEAHSEDAAPAARDAAITRVPVAIDKHPDVGLAALDHFGYAHGPGQDSYKASSKAARAQQWQTATSASAAAISAAPHHLAAQWLHGESLAVSGDHAGALGPLLASVAGDFRRFGKKPLLGDHWAAFRKSKWAAPFANARKAIGQKRRELLDGAPLLIGRTGPARTAQGLARAEVFAFSEKSERFIRVSRTAGQTVAFIASPDRKTLAVVSYAQVDPAGGVIGLAVELISMPDGTGKRFELGAAELSRFYFVENKSTSGKRADDLIIERDVIAAPTAKTTSTSSSGRHRPPGPPDVDKERRTKTVLEVVTHGDGKPAISNVSAKRERALRKRRRAVNSILLVGSKKHQLVRNSNRAVAADWSNGASDVLRLNRWRKTVALPAEVHRDSLTFSPDGEVVLASTPRCTLPRRRWIIDGATGRFEEMPTVDSVRWRTNGSLLTFGGNNLSEFDQQADAASKVRRLTRANGILGLDVIEIPCGVDVGHRGHRD